MGSRVSAAEQMDGNSGERMQDALTIVRSRFRLELVAGWGFITNYLDVTL